MKAEPTTPTDIARKLWHMAWMLALFTIFYNVAEGLISTWFGYQDDTLALFGFGIDSFIETISGIGIAHMVMRMQTQPEPQTDKFETTALKVTGTAFYILTAGLVISSAIKLASNSSPASTVPGVIISLVSIIVMVVLVLAKEKIGKALNSEPIMADARCTRVCIYMSVILLVSSGLFALTGLYYIDILGTIGIALFAVREGKECFQKAKNKSLNCSCEQH